MGKWPRCKETSMAIILRDNELIKVADSVKPDAKKRVLLPKSITVEDITYHIYINSVGQIILDPQVTIPASELWVFKNNDILESIDRGMAESVDGQGTRRGSYAKYVKDAP